LISSRNETLAKIVGRIARIFYRNSFNVGLLLLACDTDGVTNGDLLTTDTEHGEIINGSTTSVIPFHPIPAFMRGVLLEEGLPAHLKKHGGFYF